MVVWVGGKVVGWSVVSGDVEEESAVLRSSIFRTMWTGVRQNCKEWFLNLVSGSCVKEFQTLVGDDVRQVILVIVIAVMSKHSVFIQSVIVKSRVSDESVPIVPPRGHPVAIILIQVLSKVSSLVATLTEVGGKGALLMIGVPVGGGTIVVVCEHLVSIHI